MAGILTRTLQHFHDFIICSGSLFIYSPIRETRTHVSIDHIASSTEMYLIVSIADDILPGS